MRRLPTRWLTAIGGVSHAAGVGGGGACETGGSSANCGGGGGEVVRRLGVLSVCGRFDSGATRSEFVTFAGSGFGGGLGSLGYLPRDPLVSPLPGGLNCDVSTNLFGLPVDSEGVEFMGTPVGGVVPGTVEVPLTCWMPEPPTFGCAESVNNAGTSTIAGTALTGVQVAPPSALLKASPEP